MEELSKTLMLSFERRLFQLQEFIYLYNKSVAAQLNHNFNQLS